MTLSTSSHDLCGYLSTIFVDSRSLSTPKQSQPGGYYDQSSDLSLSLEIIDLMPKRMVCISGDHDTSLKISQLLTKSVMVSLTAMYLLANATISPLKSSKLTVSTPSNRSTNSLILASWVSNHSQIRPVSP